jgi:FkbM family methyltransferase
MVVLHGTFPMLSAVKAVLRRTPIYSHYFARTHAIDLDHFTAEEIRQRDLYAEFLRPSPHALVFDVGANIGTHVKLFLRLGCTVVAIEPQRTCVAALRRTFGNGIEIVHAALSDRTGTTRLHIASGSHQVATASSDWINATTKAGRFPGLTWDRQETVHTMKLDSLIAKHGAPHFIKIDVEGHELRVLNGLSHAVPALCFELTPERWDAAADCVEALSRNGTYEFDYSPGDKATLSRWTTASDFVRRLPSIKGRGDIYARLLTS